MGRNVLESLDTLPGLTTWACCHRLCCVGFVTMGCQWWGRRYWRSSFPAVLSLPLWALFFPCQAASLYFSSLGERKISDLCTGRIFFFFSAPELFYCSLNLVFGVCYFSIHIYKEWSTFTENVKKFISPRRVSFLWKQDYYQGILFLLLYGPWKVGEVSVVLVHENFHDSLTSLHLWQYLNHK